MGTKAAPSLKHSNYVEHFLILEDGRVADTDVVEEGGAPVATRPDSVMDGGSGSSSSR